MRRQLITCDRCGDEIKSGEIREIVIKDITEEYYDERGIFPDKKHFHKRDVVKDLCHDCFVDLERFLNRRTLLDSVVRGGKKYLR